MSTPPIFLPQTDVQTFGPDSTFRWATVTQVAPLRIRLDGDTLALSVTPDALVRDSDLAVGERVWVQMFGRRVLVLGGTGGFSAAYLRNATHMITGGGAIMTTPFTFNWSQRFLLISAGKGPDSADEGYFEITMPPDGTTITGVGGTSNGTVTSGSIDVGSTAWAAVWYKLPAPGSLAATNHANWFVSDYSGTDFVVPEDWVCVAVRNADLHNPHWKFCTGREVGWWTNMSYLNGWVSFDAPFAAAAYRKDNGIVFLRGLVKNGTVSSGTTGRICQLPYGFRPEFQRIETVLAGGNTLGRVDVYPDGYVNAVVGANGSFCLDNIRFLAAHD